MIWIDYKYINLVSFHLKGFEQKKSDVWNARCPFCGDSEKSERLKRFYIHLGKRERSNQFFCTCHNCSYYRSFKGFLYEIDPALFREYMYETVKDRYAQDNRYRKQAITQTSDVLPASQDDFLTSLPRIKELSEGHFAFQYCKDRQLPLWVLNEFRWADNFKKVADRMNKDSSENLNDNDPRIIIPFYDEFGDVSVIQGRTIIDSVKPKYITIKTNDDVNKFYGVNRINQNKPVIVMEGPIDSLFVENAVATGDSDLIRYSDGNSYCFDNQPRNHQIVEKMKRTIDSGYPVFIWPSFMGCGKDINQMVCDGIVQSKDLHDLIMKNTFSGLKAKLAFQSWKRV